MDLPRITSVLVTLAIIADQVRNVSAVKAARAVTELERSYVLSVMPFI